MGKSTKTYGAEYLIAALMLIIAATVISWQLNRSVVITEMSVQDNHMADADEIMRKSGLTEGMHGDSIAFLDVIKRVETMPWVETAYVNLSPSGRIRIRVVEEEPMALLVDHSRAALVTESGVIMPVVLEKDVDVPLLHGFNIPDETQMKEKPDTLRSESFDKSRKFLTAVSRYPGLYAMISEVMVSDSDGVVALTDDNAVRLTFGHDHYDERLRKWQTFQSKVISEKGINRMRTLDFRFQDQIVAREKQSGI